MIRSFKDKHKGERCFICATGPSLNKMDLTLLDDEITFGVNSFYKTGRSTTYYGVSDMHVWFRHKYNFKSLDTQFFIGGRASPLYDKAPIDMVKQPMVLTDKNHGGFSYDIEGGVYSGDSVIYDICLQVCYYMGFDEVYLIGLDWDYSSKKKHFDGSAVANMSGGAIGDWEKCIRMFNLAREEYKKAGRKLYNATVGGKCNVFERASFNKLF